MQLLLPLVQQGAGQPLGGTVEVVCAKFKPLLGPPAKVGLPVGEEGVGGPDGGADLSGGGGKRL